MTLSSPRTLAQFFDAILWSYPKPFVLRQSSDIADREDGRTLASMSGGMSKWRFRATVQTNVHDVAVEYQARITPVYNSILSFYAYDFRRPYPKLDPTGSIIGANAVQINSFSIANSTISLKALTATYVISMGDYIQVTWGGGLYTLLLQALETVTAVAGVTPVFQITPDLPLGIAVNDAVNLKKPSARFVITPGSFSEGNVDRMMSDGMELEFEEE